MLSGFSTIDLFIALFVGLVVVRGARTGFLAGMLSLVGVIVGASVGSRVAQHLLSQSASATFGTGITLISILAFAVLGDIVARFLGGSLRARLVGERGLLLDGFGGALLGLALSLTLVWAVGVFALQSPVAGVRPVVASSQIVRELDRNMPSALLTQAVARLDPLPQIRGPEVSPGAPDGSALKDPNVRAAAASTVRITGLACGYGVEGSGWVAAPDLVVTNAHVVAGEATTSVQPGGVGPSYDAQVVLFDKRNDVAVLRVPGLGLNPLPIAPPRPGETAAAIGYPGNGPLDVQPARTGDTQRVISSDAYGRGPVERTVTGFRAFVRPGNSGGPVVNRDGEVVATVFASRADSKSAGYGIPSSIVGRKILAAANRFEPVPSSSCAD